MTAVLLTTLFLGCGLLAGMSMATTWRRYGSAARALKMQVAACEATRMVRVRISEVRVQPTATVLRPNFKAAARLSQPAALPAAA